MVLLLVRHAMPTASAQSPPESWHLTPEGRADAAELLSTLPPQARLYASDEPKAWETLGGPSDVTRDARFNEVIRIGEPWEGNFQLLRRQYVDGVSHPGWEPQATAAARFQAGVLAVLEEAADSDRPAVIATHGMVMTTWLVSRGAVMHSVAGDFWADLRFPDCLIVDTALPSVRRYLRRVPTEIVTARVSGR